MNPNFTMNLSGILVTAVPARLAEVTAALDAMPGLEVRQSDAATGRIVVVQEAAEVGRFHAHTRAGGRDQCRSGLPLLRR